jgi:hypothetical protein
MLLCELMWGYFLHVITACTYCCLRLYFSESLLVLPCRWRDYFVFSTFGLCRVSYTSYIKWVYCSCWMVVLLIVKYMNFFTGDGIIIVFSYVNLGGSIFLWTLLIHVITACTSCYLRMYFSESLLVLPRRWHDYFVFSTFGLCRVSCTSYIKWVYCSTKNCCERDT